MSDIDLVQHCRDALNEEGVVLDETDLSRDTELLSLVDSVTLMDVIARVEEQIGVVLPDDVLSRLSTIADLEEAAASCQRMVMRGPTDGQ